MTDTEAGDGQHTETASIELRIGEYVLRASVTVPAAPVPPTRMLPVFRSIGESAVEVAVNQEKAVGREISCRAGCGACCRQLVPISRTEAHRIGELVNEMPSSRRSEILRRFERALDELSRKGLLVRLQKAGTADRDTLRALGLEYFALGIPCPFLEDESCSIYEERPIVCREYLVTSPPENCLSPSAETVKQVQLPRRASNALAFLGEDNSRRTPPWIPLPMAIEWSRAHADSNAPRPPRDMFGEFIERLTAPPAADAPQ